MSTLKVNTLEPRSSTTITVPTGNVFTIADNSGISIGGTVVSATAAQLNVMASVTASATEINVLDGIPAGLSVSLEDLQAQMAKRAPGNLKGTTARKEADQVEILSGGFEGKTLGSPISVIVRNTNQRSQDYDKLKDEYRPGHADATTMQKFGVRDR